ncbi:unnamed protein product [Oncorhynchus mykiss]|uniref:VWFC domain-containing protein n=1 Tax=Oncorhynchus mykiss TaxID=8022 RepID=A0A060ZC48_ONCMY|nr:unnamed protein product [Oncorhynchus mykiss]
MPSYCRNEEGDIFLAAESWKPNTCSSCVCLDGQISCFSESCPPVGCARPVLRKGQCCPYCLDATPRAVCHFNGKTYADEERWDIDSCTHCYCLQGQTLCSTVSCPALPCHQPTIVEGSCCPMCSGVCVCVCVCTRMHACVRVYLLPFTLIASNEFLPPQTYSTHARTHTHTHTHTRVHTPLQNMNCLVINIT